MITTTKPVAVRGKHQRGLEHEMLRLREGTAIVEGINLVEQDAYGLPPHFPRRLTHAVVRVQVKLLETTDSEGQRLDAIELRRIDLLQCGAHAERHRKRGCEDHVGQLAIQLQQPAARAVPVLLVKPAADHPLIPHGQIARAEGIFIPLQPGAAYLGVQRSRDVRDAREARVNHGFDRPPRSAAVVHRDAGER